MSAQAAPAAWVSPAIKAMSTRRTRWRPGPWLALAGLFVLSVAGGAAWFYSPYGPAPRIDFSLPTPASAPEPAVAEPSMAEPSASDPATLAPLPLPAASAPPGLDPQPLPEVAPPASTTPPSAPPQDRPS